MKNRVISKKNFIVFIFSFSASFSSLLATPAQFELKATFKRNPKIWGTYKLSDELVTISRGNRKWRKTPPERIGDIVISDGNLVFVRETQTNNQTTIVVDKIPYKKVGSSRFEGKLTQPHQKDVLAKLFERDLKQLIPHRDLLEGEINYESVQCNKRRAALVCHLKGKLTP